MVVEPFKNAIPLRVATCVIEQKLSTALKAADFVLTHKGFMEGRPGGVGKVQMTTVASPVVVPSL